MRSNIIQRYFPFIWSVLGGQIFNIQTFILPSNRRVLELIQHLSYDPEVTNEFAYVENLGIHLLFAQIHAVEHPAAINPWKCEIKLNMFLWSFLQRSNWLQNWYAYSTVLYLWYIGARLKGDSQKSPGEEPECHLRSISNWPGQHTGLSCSSLVALLGAFLAQKTLGWENWWLICAPIIIPFMGAFLSFK